MNYGKITGDTYRKDVDFSKAVLWKNREISLSPKILESFGGVKIIEFYDAKKDTLWWASFEKVMEAWKLKKEGQEEQYYIPISVFKIIKNYSKQK